MASLVTTTVTGTLTTTDDIILTGTRAIKNTTSAGVLTIQGGQSWPGGKIILGGGNAAGGDIKFYTGLSTATPAERVRIDSNGNVGIEIDSPVAKLHIDDSATGDNKALYIQNTHNTDGDSAAIRFGFAGNDNANKGGIFFKRTANYGRGSLIFATENTANDVNVENSDAKLTILADGKVGIGTTVPAELFHVNGNGRFDDYLSVNTSGKYQTLTVNGNIWLPGSSGTITWSNGDCYIQSVSGYHMRLVTYDGVSAGVENLRLKSGGNVGVNGITDPLAPLHVNGNAVITSGKQLISTNAYTQAPPAMLTTVGPSTGATPLSSGAWGIMMGPEVTRSTAANIYYPGIAFNHLLNHNGASTWHNHPQAWIGTRLHDTTGSERAFLVFSTKSGTGLTSSDVPLERMCIDPAYGSVGIGTTDPAAQLQIGRSQTTSAFTDSFIKLRPSNTTNATGLTSITLGTSTVDNYGYSISGWRAGTDGSPYLRIKRHNNSASGDDVMVMDNSGNVGIGTTSPDELLHLNKTSGTTIVKAEVAANSTVGFEIKKTGSTTQNWRIVDGQTVNGVLEFYDVTDTATRLAIKGDGQLQFNSYGSGTHTGTSAYKLSVDSSGNIIETAIGAGAVDGSGTANYITRWTDADTIGNSNIFDNGAIGVGTAANLNSVFNVYGATSSGPTSIITCMSQHATVGGGAGIFFKTSNNTTLNRYGAQIAAIRNSNDNGSPDLVFNLEKTDATGSAERMRILGDGNVGIGTTAPSRLFHVNGGSDYNARFTSASTRSGIVIDKPGTTTIMGSALVLASDETYRLGTASYYHVVCQQGGGTLLQYQGSTKLTTTSGGVTVTGTLTETSSIAIKENVETYTPSLDIINKIRPVKYNRKENKKKEIGLIAEELAELFPELVEKDEKGNPSSVNYSRAVTVLFGGFKELYKEVQELKKRI